MCITTYISKGYRVLCSQKFTCVCVYTYPRICVCIFRMDGGRWTLLASESIHMHVYKLKQLPLAIETRFWYFLAHPGTGLNVYKNHSFSTLSEEKLLSTLNRDIFHFTKTLEWVAFLIVISSVRMSMSPQRFLLARRATLNPYQDNAKHYDCIHLNTKSWGRCWPNSLGLRAFSPLHRCIWSYVALTADLDEM